MAYRPKVWGISWLKMQDEVCSTALAIVHTTVMCTAFFQKNIYIFVLCIKLQFEKVNTIVSLLKGMTKWEHWNWNKQTIKKDKNTSIFDKILGGDYH